MTVPTFQDLIKIWFDRKVLGLSNGKHAQQNWNTMATYVFPHLANMPIDQIKIAFGRVVKTVRHQPSLHWSRAPELWQWMLTANLVEDCRQMMMIMLLTGKRTKEVRLIDWTDINRNQLIWTSQQERMKMRRENHVPICHQLEVVFDNMKLLNGPSKNVFARPKNKSGVIDETRHAWASNNLIQKLPVMVCAVHFGHGFVSKNAM